MVASQPQRTDFLEEALRVVEAADERGITLRVMGAVAVRIHCPEFLSLHNSLNRKLTDIDFIGYGKQKIQIAKLMKYLGYSIRKEMLIFEGRYFFYDQVNNRKVDIFLDMLDMNHKIDFRGRLEVDFPTISLADLLLEKLQIVRINEKDIKDALVLLRAHEVCEDEDHERINSSYIAKTLSRDWGFYYTAITNLEKVLKFSKKYNVFSEEDRAVINRRAKSLTMAIESEPKSIKWKMRAKIGTHKRWYKEVGEAER